MFLERFRFEIVFSYVCFHLLGIVLELYVERFWDVHIVKG